MVMHTRSTTTAAVGACRPEIDTMEQKFLAEADRDAERTGTGYSIYVPEMDPGACLLHVTYESVRWVSIWQAGGPLQALLPQLHRILHHLCSGMAASQPVIKFVLASVR